MTSRLHSLNGSQQTSSQRERECHKFVNRLQNAKRIWPSHFDLKCRDEKQIRRTASLLNKHLAARQGDATRSLSIASPPGMATPSELRKRRPGFSLDTVLRLYFGRSFMINAVLGTEGKQKQRQRRFPLAEPPGFAPVVFALARTC